MNILSRQPPASLTLTALSGIPLLSPGDNLVSIILQSLKQSNLSLENGDILVIAQKV
ncbi:MAG: coenzyme F420-0:L-glutamate ligase, partial [Candidatus Marinimicrobia bacterium]|nr:coenzyme F420-0:L-glutamate ligase [Candidatus Neomarinimicrobiota bacterium]